MDQEKVGKFIKKLRKNNNLTQQELAEKLSVTYQAVSKWENGKSIPDISTLKLISELFNVNIEELLDGNKSKKKSFFNKKNIIIISIILILVVCILSFFAFHKETYQFKVLETDSDKFDVSGVLAFSSDKSSIYISSINYNAKDDDKYKVLECDLYDVNGDSKTKISSCKSDTDDLESLNQLLNEINFKVDDYASSCKIFKKNQLVLEINATNQDDKIITYKIPLSFDDDCFNSTDS